MEWWGIGDTFYGTKLDFTKKAIREMAGEGAYEIKPPSVDWDEKEIEIEIHCDAGGNSD